MPALDPRSPRPQARRRVPKRVGRPPASDGELTRRRILDAAQVCFSTHGYRETSNRLVADAAHITPGTIYHYFANKQDLFLNVHEEIQRSIIDALEAVITPELTFSESIDKMLRVFLEIYIEHPNWTKFTSVVRTEARRNPEISAAQNDKAWRDIFRRLAEKGVASGEIDSSSRRAMQAVLSAVVFGLTQHGIEASATDHVECVRGFGLLLRGMLVKPQLAGAV